MSTGECNAFGREFGRNVTNAIVKKPTAPKSPVPQPNINCESAPLSVTGETVTAVVSKRSRSNSSDSDSNEVLKKRRVERSSGALHAEPVPCPYEYNNHRPAEQNDNGFSVEYCFDEDLREVQRSPSVSAKLLDAVEVSERAVMRGLSEGTLSPSPTPPLDAAPLVIPMFFTVSPSP